MVGLNELINGITSVLLEEKAYNLPNVCLRYGLENGDDKEAYVSRKLYVEKRLKGKNQLFLIDIAKRIAKDYQSKELAKLLNLIAPSGIFRITQITRQLIMDYYYSSGDIQGELDLIEFLKRIWNLDEMPPVDTRYPNATRDIIQHMYANDDWEIDYLYKEYLDIYNVNDETFISFLEQTVHPLVRKNDQLEYVENLNKYLLIDGFKLQVGEYISGYPIFFINRLFDGVKGNVKNLIFSADGLKPEIVLSDSINNDIKIVKNEKFCLVYNQPIPTNGLLWSDLVDWWKEYNNLDDIDLINVERDLYKRLFKSLDSEPEKILFKSYFEYFRVSLGEKLPALIPQVYLYYDPYTIKQLDQTKRLFRQRMDFLLLFSNQTRIVLEVDGKQHYSVGDKSSPKNYADMVCEDRELKLNGYQVFRFGGYELTDTEESRKMVKDFFDKLFKKYIL